MLLAVVEKLQALLNEGSFIPLTPSKIVAARLGCLGPPRQIPPGQYRRRATDTQVHPDEPPPGARALVNLSRLPGFVNDPCRPRRDGERRHQIVGLFTSGATFGTGEPGGTAAPSPSLALWSFSGPRSGVTGADTSRGGHRIASRASGAPSIRRSRSRRDRPVGPRAKGREGEGCGNGRGG
jgi:hypothetical protein